MQYGGNKCNMADGQAVFWFKLIVTIDTDRYKFIY
jgi:hypothetical protein